MHVFEKKNDFDAICIICNFLQSGSRGNHVMCITPSNKLRILPDDIRRQFPKEMKLHLKPNNIARKITPLKCSRNFCIRVTQILLD